MTIAFISDLHLSAQRPSSLTLFNDFLEKSGCLLSELYILGDLFDYWIGDDGTDTLGYGSIEQALRKTTEAGTRVYFIAGNRDFLVGSDFAARTGIELLEDMTVLDLYGQRVMIAHGDRFCIDDVAYMQAREHFLNPEWQKQVLQTPIEERVKAALELREHSQETKRNKAEEIMDVNPGEIERVFREYKLDIMIHGHTHRPYVHRLEVDGRQCRRYVLGEWINSRSVIYANEGKYYLKR